MSWQGWRRSGWLASLAAFGLGITFAVVPLPPTIASEGLDASWSQALHVAARDGMAFGTQLVFTYGPLGYVHTRMYWPGLFPVTLAFWLLVALAILDAWRGVARGGGPVAIGVAALLYLALALSAIYTYDAIVFTYLLLWTWQVESERPGPARLAAHGAVVGMIALSKLTFGIAGLLAALLCGASLAVRGGARRAWIPAVASTLAFLAGWVAMGQSIGALPEYVANGMQIVRGYEEAMSLRGPRWEMRAFGATVLVLVGLSGITALRKRDAGMLAAVAFTVALFMLAWKQAFTRHDEHAFLAFTFGCAAAAAIGARFAREMPRRAAALGLVAAAMGATAVGSIVLRGHYPLMAVVNDIVWRPLRAAAHLADAPTWPARHEAALADIRSAHKLPPVPGRVDIYSHDQAVVFAHGLQWQPRPVFQSYSAYTAPLVELNRRHLEGPSAPDHILFKVQSIDRRYPALEDGASWLALLERYQVRDEGAYLLFDRAAAPRPAIRRPLPSWRGRGWLELPLEPQVVLAGLHVHESRSARHLFRSATVFDLEVRIAGEAEARKFRFVRGAAEVPFMLSPFVESHSELAALSLPCATETGRKVTAVRILHPGGAEAEFSARLEAIDSVPGFPESPGALLRATACTLRPVTGGHAVPLFLGDDLGRGLNVHPPSRYRVDRAVRSIEVCTRLAAGGRQPGGSDGYELMLARQGAEAPIVLRKVGPAEVAGGVEACVGARFATPVNDLELRVAAGGHTAWDWVYVSKLAIDE